MKTVWLYNNWLPSTLLILCTQWICNTLPVAATDYFLTIGGGYSPSGNQASLEANVVFFQGLLAEQHRGPRRHDVFFADGNDPAADLQVMAEKPTKGGFPATELLASLHRRRGGGEITYRNHSVPDVAGPLEPKLVREALESIGTTAGVGDRLIIYVTAHGSEGSGGDRYNTTIDCWNEKRISAREFTAWLDKLPKEVPVVLVMAQCYCGGFSRVMFQEFDEKKELSPQLRAGFFAQQHDLPAAGCRPDIEHDEEFSSYFWGAMAGKSRNGVPIKGCDLDGDGNISFAEAYAHAMIAGETIDIPLRTSEVFLRTYSKLKAPESSSEAKEQVTWFAMSGNLGRFVENGRPVSSRIVAQLSETLGLALVDDITKVSESLDESRRAGRFQGRPPRQRSGRRELLKEVAEKWPELGDRRSWTESSLLKPDNQEQLLMELKQLPSWKAYDERREQMATADKEADQREVRTVKRRRLLNTLESIALEKNLPLVAAPEVVAKYQQLLSLEESGLNASANPK